jgi:hemerythrin
MGKFPALGNQEGEHHRVLGELLQFNRNVKRGRLSLARAYFMAGLPEWFERHLSTMDSALAAHVKNRFSGMHETKSSSLI